MKSRPVVTKEIVVLSRTDCLELSYIQTNQENITHELRLLNERKIALQAKSVKLETEKLQHIQRLGLMDKIPFTITMGMKEHKDGTILDKDKVPVTRQVVVTPTKKK